MQKFQIVSVDEELEDQERGAAFRVLARLGMMGLPVRGDLEVNELLLATTVAQLHEAGLVAGWPTESDRLMRLAGPWEQLWDAIDASPYPFGEWEPAIDLLGDDLLATLVGISPSSLRRYASGERRTPDRVAARLHEVGRIVAALAGSYNAYGIRRWFARPRPQLEGAAPADLLSGDWSPDDEPVRFVVALAEALLGAAPAT